MNKCDREKLWTNSGRDLLAASVSAGLIVAGEDYTDPDYPAKKAQQEKDLGFGVTVFFLPHGGYLPYKSRVAPALPGLDYDLLGRLVEEYHKRGMKFVAGWVTTVDSYEYTMKRHPDWVEIKADGTPGICPCFVSPFGEYLYAQIHEVLERYDVDGIYFDQLPTACYCSYCQEQFRQRFGYELKVDKQLKSGSKASVEELAGISSFANMDGDQKLFETENTFNFLSKSKSIRDELKPSAVFWSNKIWGPDSAHYRTIVDGIFPEYRYWAAGSLHNVTLNRKITEAYSGGRPMWDCPAYDVRLHLRARPATEAILQIAEGVANNASVLFRSIGVLEHDLVNQEKISTALLDMEKIRTRRRQAKQVSYCALVHSLNSHSGMVRRYPPEKGALQSDHKLGLEGIHNLIIENHIPYKVVSEEDIQNGVLGDFKVVVLAETDTLAPAAMDAIEAFVNSGGGVVAIGRAASANNRKLCEILGVDSLGLRNIGDDKEDLRYEMGAPLTYRWSGGKGPFTYGQLRKGHPLLEGLEEALIDWDGGYMDVVPKEGVTVLADTRAFDYYTWDAKPTIDPVIWPGRPIAPFLVVKETPGRTACFTGLVGAEHRRFKCTTIGELISRAITWAAGATPCVQFDEHLPNVRMVVDELPYSKGKLVMLVNHATNESSRGGFAWVSPVSNFRLSIKWPSNTGAVLKPLVEIPITFEMHEDYVEVLIERLDIYTAFELRETE